MITPIQNEIFSLAANDGMSNGQIAYALKMSVNAVKCQIYRAYPEFGVRCRVQAVAVWKAQHPAPPPPKPQHRPAPLPWPERRAAILASRDAAHHYIGKPVKVPEAEQQELF